MKPESPDETRYLVYAMIGEYWKDALRGWLHQMFPPRPVLYGYVIGYELGTLRSQNWFDGAHPILRHAAIRDDGVLILDAPYPWEAT